MLKSIGKQSGECVESILKKKRWEGFAEKVLSLEWEWGVMEQV